ncbi:sodium-dependent multivitamin transporter-like [Dendronephthya gigantea]|uniref:sodium-dependent multivitamin transporter-like n=1 Tax=Dendronephthya gigantea TaxID=151771 RepID=UPI00106C6A58|nr:sodium-dependent multivitamin transporter-like [Dendronephthya gigantea]
MSTLRFHVADYAVFGLTLVLSVAVGIYHAVISKPSTTKEYLLASRKMMSIPVALSLLASFMSGITILGVPSEIYTFGLQYWLVVVSYFLAFPSVALIFVPILYELGLTSSYEYLERRFSFGIRIIGTILFIIYTLFYMAIVTYGPSLALESVTGLPIWVSILSIGVVCTFYTTIGGIRAVIWNDVFQAVVMLGGLVIVVIVGTSKAGGASHVLSILQENNRTSVSFSFDPKERTTFWVMFIGGAFAILPLWSVNQTAVQRFLSAKSLKDAQRSVWMALPLSLLTVSLCSLCGAVIFAYYVGCDPKKRQAISSSDQILPYFVMDVIGHLHGLPGVFLACLFSGTLSTLSSGMNSLAAVVLEDFVKPFVNHRNLVVSESRLTLLSKCIAATLGLVTVGLSFLGGTLGTILQSFYQVSGVAGGPVVAIYSIGMFTKFANKKGAYVGLISGFAFGLFVAIGAKIHKPPLSIPKVSIDRCPDANLTTTVANTTKIYDGLDIYKTSPFWYSFYCFFITFVVGLLVSFLWKDGEQNVDPRLLFKWKRLLPAKFTGHTDVQSEQGESIGLHNQDSGNEQVVNTNQGKQKHADSVVLMNSDSVKEMSTNL